MALLRPPQAADAFLEELLRPPQVADAFWGELLRPPQAAEAFWGEHFYSSCALLLVAYWCVQNNKQFYKSALRFDRVMREERSVSYVADRPRQHTLAVTGDGAGQTLRPADSYLPLRSRAASSPTLTHAVVVAAADAPVCDKNPEGRCQGQDQVGASGQASRHSSIGRHASRGESWHVHHARHAQEGDAHQYAIAGQPHSQASCC